MAHGSALGAYNKKGWCRRFERKFFVREVPTFFLFGTISQCIASWLDYKLFAFQDDVIFRQHAAETAQKSTPVHGQPASKLSQAEGGEGKGEKQLPSFPALHPPRELARTHVLGVSQSRTLSRNV